MENGEIISINIGKPVQVQFNNREVSTGIFETPSDEPLFRLGLTLRETVRQILPTTGAGRKPSACIPMNIIHIGRRYWIGSWNIAPSERI